MSKSEPVNRTPLRYRIKRAQVRGLPIVFFALICGACAYLWQYQNKGIVEVGLVEVVSHVVVSPREGVVVGWASQNGKTLPVHTFVNENDIVAMLDDKPLLSQLQTLTRQLASMQETVALQIQAKDSDQPNKALLMAWEAIDSFAAQTMKQIDGLNQRFELRRVDMQIANLKKSAVDTNEINQLQAIQTARMALAVQVERAKNTAAFGDSKAVDINQLQAINEREFLNANRLMFLKLRETCQSIDTQLLSARISAESLDIVSPFRGQVEKSFVQTNETIAGGDPVVTLTATEGSFILVYARENGRVLPTAGTPVVLNMRSNPAVKTNSAVESVGAKFVSIPERQRLNPAMEEWGRVMRIPVPANFNVVPGSLVDVTFYPGRSVGIDQPTTARAR